MKLIPNRILALIALPVTVVAGPTRAARVSEPPTMLYGRVVFRSAGHEIVLHQGTLVWTLRGTAPKPWEKVFRTTLVQLGEGTLSYRLEVPQDLVALDLSASPGAVPMLALPANVTIAGVTFEGAPATPLAPAANFFGVRQSTRASSLRVDLDVSAALADSDGDGLPDVWENQQGFDPWNPRDGIAYFAPAPADPGNPASPGTASAPTTFAAWRALHFPEDARPLEEFAAADADQDGIPNLVEYAFDLNPKDATDTAGLERLPQARVRDGRLQLEFQRHPGRSDVDYAFEVSGDLTHWEPAADLVATESGAELAASSATGHVRLQDSRVTSGNAARFVRVRVSRHP